MLLLQLSTLHKGIILKRPSATCKTPYVADVLLEDNTYSSAHTASLGWCGLCNANSCVYMIDVNNSKNTCKFKIVIAHIIERGIPQSIGTDPKIAELLVNNALECNALSWLNNIKQFKREKKYLNSRFDFQGIDENNNEFILEVKNVPLADYVDMLDTDKKKLDLSKFSHHTKIAYFPDGYRKKATDTVSPRALKHIQELEELVTTHNIRTILCFVIQRDDVTSFQPSNIDPIYQSAVIKAHKNGVEIKAILIKWSLDGQALLINDDLNINLL